MDKTINFARKGKQKPGNLQIFKIFQQICYLIFDISLYCSSLFNHNKYRLMDDKKGYLIVLLKLIIAEDWGRLSWYIPRVLHKEHSGQK